MLGAEIPEVKQTVSVLRSSPSSDGQTCKQLYLNVISALREKHTKSYGNVQSPMAFGLKESSKLLFFFFLFFFFSKL